jgi:seryl-tRNA synthetase
MTITMTSLINCLERVTAERDALHAENTRLTAEREAEYIKWQEKYAKVKQERDELSPLIKSLKSTGGRLSNIVYNIEQVKDRLPKHMQSDLKKLIKEWDSLMSELPEISLAKRDLESEARGIINWLELDMVLTKRTKPSTYEQGVRDTLLNAHVYANQLTKQAEGE